MYIQEISGSNLGGDTEHSENVEWFYPVAAGECRDSTDTLNYGITDCLHQHPFQFVTDRHPIIRRCIVWVTDSAVK
jgi:hypothetical protein